MPSLDAALYESRRADRTRHRLAVQRQRHHGVPYADARALVARLERAHGLPAVVAAAAEAEARRSTPEAYAVAHEAPGDRPAARPPLTGIGGHVNPDGAGGALSTDASGVQTPA